MNKLIYFFAGYIGSFDMNDVFPLFFCRDIERVRFNLAFSVLNGTLAILLVRSISLGALCRLI